MKKIVTVFGSSQPVPGDEEYETAYGLGLLLGEAGLSVCTGGYQGIMDAVSKGAAEKGQEAIGITVDLFNAVPSRYLTKNIECHSLFERIQKLIESGDAYIILRGGTGTLVELSIAWEMVNKRLIKKKPVACHGSMWEPLINLMDKRMKMENRETGLVAYFESIDRCVEYIISSI
ncbi:MAG: LOG family protein [Melioribacteraceae bacterium]|nr:LOG family protein [Melioribacteraceae bacterium]